MVQKILCWDGTVEKSIEDIDSICSSMPTDSQQCYIENIKGRWSAIFDITYDTVAC